ncbi:unnamed protein product [Acanthoscelides obtectus]|uniref:SAM domain-containing protein n=1 Tax=Acanthoscelides obtectus TaxID=200917 RepID=A0A9P0KT74_ACAOB|nr:unnamed protein product [Acanthoscelides obtectus]CAK1677050.1 hypothetical protein AOBTE_LOCUS31082 [Acanthoscelides obtectus]
MELNNIKSLNKEQLLQCIKQSGFADIANILSMENIDGNCLMTMPEIQILQWKMPIGERKKVVKFINDVKSNPSILSIKSLTVPSNIKKSTKTKTDNVATTTKASTPYSKPPRANNPTVTKPPMPLPQEDRNAGVKQNNIDKHKMESTIIYDHPRNYSNEHDNEGMKMNNLLEPDESYIDMGSNVSISKDDSYLVSNRSKLTIENQLDEEPNYEAPPDKPAASSLIKVESVTVKKVKLKLRTRELPDLPSDTYQSVDEETTNHTTVNVEKQRIKPSVRFSFLHGALMKSLRSKPLKLVSQKSTTVSEKWKEVKGSNRPLSGVPHTEPEDLKAAKKTSAKECKPPLMPKAKKPWRTLLPNGDNDAIYENVADEGRFSISRHR